MKIVIHNQDYTTLPENYKDYLNKQSFSEGGWYAPCLRVSFHEYILQYPKILRNILKIAEKPCNYLKNMRGENCYRRLYLVIVLESGHIETKEHA